MKQTVIESKLEYKVFDWLRFPLIVGVVFIHCFGRPFDYDALVFSNLSGYDFYNLFRVSISQVLTHVCVPTFYFISGYLFFKGLEVWDGYTYKEKIKRRIKSLLIPFLIWNTISVLLKIQSCLRHEGIEGALCFFSDNNYWHLYWDCQEWNLDRTNWIGGEYSASSPYLIPLWFLRDLMVVSFCSPVLYYLLRKTKIWGVILLGICYITGVFLNVPGFSITTFFFFGLGAYMKMYNINPLQATFRFRYVLLLLTVLLWLCCTLLNGHNTKEGDIVYPFYIITGFFTLINIATHLVKNNIITIPPLLTKGAFFVYLAHTVLIQEFCTKIINAIFGESNPLYMSLAYVTTPLLIIMICISGYYVLTKYFPAVSSILTGER